MRLYKEELGLYYETKDDYVTIVEGNRKLESIVIPEKIDGFLVRQIQKKSFLGCKLLKSIYVPQSVEDIGDFAFALCDHLTMISFPHCAIRLGQSMVKNDAELSQILVRREDIDEKIMTDASFLMGAAPIKMDADYLVDISQAGTDDWFRRWDQKLMDILSRKEDEGYHLYVLCGEEDLHFDYDQYVEYIKERRSGLCISRLMHASKLSDENQRKLKEYLLRMSSDDSLDRAPVFSYLLKEHGDDREYFELLIEQGVITKENREALLLLMKDRHPQTKAFLINAFSNEEDSVGDFFDNLLL